jgi:hypothetical protein
LKKINFRFYYFFNKRFFEHLKKIENIDIKLEEVKEKIKNRPESKTKKEDKFECDQDELFDDVQNLFD